MSNHSLIPFIGIQRRYLGRFRQIAKILVRHGFGFIIAELGLSHLVPLQWGMIGQPPGVMPYTQAEHMRMAFEELGATFIKLGQILSTRSDLLPPEYVEELSKLQDAVPPERPGVIEGVIVKEMKKPLSETFASFDPDPLGSASIGQVHAATLHTGEEIVVKVQRPNIGNIIEQDLAIFFDLARLASGRTVWGQIYDLVGLVQEFADTLQGELDYIQEGRNADQIARNFKGSRAVHVPRIYWSYTTRRVLTMERLHGVKINDLDGLRRMGINRHRLARRGTRVILKMVFEDGFFHADPHPGNFFIDARGRIGMMDFGIVGRLSEEMRDNLLFLFLAILQQDMDRIVDRLTDLGVVGTIPQLGRLKEDLSRLITVYYGLPLKEMDIRKMLDDFLDVARRHRLQVPTRLTLLDKTLSMHEALARNLDPDFNMAEVLEPYAEKASSRVYSFSYFKDRVLPSLIDLGRLAVVFPRRVDRLTTQAERGNLLVNIRLIDAQLYMKDLDRMITRLVLAIVSAGLVVGLSILLLLFRPPGHDILITALFALGFTITGALALWLTYSLLVGKPR